MSTQALADPLEQGIELNLAEMHAERELADQDERGLARLAREQAELDEREVEIFHRLRKLPEAADPNSEVAGWVRLINSAWRKRHRRPRVRRRKK